ncbi:zinc finger protein 710-like [Topomyia yanbarensis]|uniref:zinc finger protein 710-like n=1 Tax=Topomyia yanbarensis TaxID=2498891 RepID=UPI00273AD546|nr:zinc finger protein 710-like [Topomyia yanbarensis]
MEGQWAKPRYVSKWALRKEALARALVQEYKCGICLNEFKTKQMLSIHITNHHGPKRAQSYKWVNPALTGPAPPKPQKCETCSRVYMTEDQLRQHINTHFQKSSYDCYICDKRFPADVPLIGHLYYECDTEKKVVPLNNPKRPEADLMLYTIKRVRCMVCQIPFANLEKLKKHMAKKRHMEVCRASGKLACDMCQVIFPTTDRYAEHTCAFVC